MVASSYVFLILLLFFVLFDFVLGILPVVIVFLVWLLVSWSILREQKIRTYRMYGGKKVITGTLGEEEDMGEIVEFRVKKIVPFDSLTEYEKGAMEKLIEAEENYVKMLDIKDTRYESNDKNKD